MARDFRCTRDERWIQVLREIAMSVIGKDCTAKKWIRILARMKDNRDGLISVMT